MGLNGSIEGSNPSFSASAAPAAVLRPPAEGWQSGRMRRSRKPLSVVRRIEGSNPSPSASPSRRSRVGPMVLHVQEWGDPQGEPLVCLHGVTGYAGVYRRLAEERWSERRVLAFDLRGHGRSGWEPPWTFATHVADLVETSVALGLSAADWVGHSFGGRLVLELASAQPQLVRRAGLLDPAIQLLPHVALDAAEFERREPVYRSAEDYVQERLLMYPDSPRAAIEHEAAQHLEL